MTDSGSGGVHPDETAFAPLRVGKFRALWMASIFSNVGSFFQVTAGSWLMWEMTESPAWVGWMSASRGLPLLFIALPAGALADRVHRASLIITTHVIMAVVASVLAIVTGVGLITPGLLLLLGIALGTGGAFNAPAWHSLVPDVVPRAMVTSAVALNSVAFNVARAVGPAIAGIVVATLGAAAAFGLNAVSYLAMIFVLVVVSRRLAEPTLDHSSMVNAVVSGVRFARHTSAFRRILAIGALYALGSSVLQAMLPVRTEELGESAGTYGLLLGVIGVGAALGGVSVRRVTRLLGRHAISSTIVLYGIAGTFAGLGTTTLLTAIPLFLAGMCWVWTLSTLNATIQLMSPDWVRGRAVSLWLLAHAGVVPIGSIIAGFIAEAIGAGQTLVVLSLATVVLGVATRFWGVQDPSSVETPEFSERRTHHHPPASEGQVMIHNTWEVHPSEAEAFVEAMREVRSVRLRTGGFRWRMFREVGSPGTFTEVFLIRSWEDHLQQHRRIDDASAAVIGRARSFDISPTGPISRHSVRVETRAGADLPAVGSDFADHRVMHATDGSIPLRETESPSSDLTDRPADSGQGGRGRLRSWIQRG